MSTSHDGHVDVVKVLLENNAQVDLKDCHGQSSLMAASHGGHVDVVQMLLESDAHACQFTRYKVEIFFGDCSKNNHVHVVKMLLDRSIYKIVMDSPL